MSRRALLIGGGVVAAGGLLLLVLSLNLGSVVKRAVELVGPRLTGTDVRVRSVTLSPLSGRGRVRGFRVGNPSGFKAPEAFAFDSVKIAVELASLRGEKVRVREIIVDGLELSYEPSLSGSNLARIQRNVQAYVPASSDGKSGQATKVEIDLFRVTNAKVRLALGGAAVAVPLPPIEVRGIGRGAGGATVGEAAAKLLASVTGPAIQAAAGAGADKLGDAGKAAAGLLKGLFDKRPR